MLHFQINNEIMLRPFRQSDAESVFLAVRENVDHLHTFLQWATTDYTFENAQEFIEHSIINAAENKNQGFGIFSRDRFVGSIGFVKFSGHNRRTEIGYWITKDSEGRGIITKSCIQLINYAFDKLEMNRIEIRCATENIRSRAVPERLDFKLDGILRQSEWRHTRFFDLAVYSMLREEWITRLSVSSER